VILVDSSVWIDYLRGGDTPQVRKLDTLLGTVPLAVGDLIVVEVLQGCPSDREFDEVARLLQTFQQVELCGSDVKVEAARNFRRLRALGITPRKTIDTVIATRCLVSDYELLHDDRDFEPFERHLGLRCVDCRA
jgi:predicted nucleic acid-binding protein